MRYVDFRLQNYKSHRDTGWVKLGEGINTIIGQNDTGKSALLQALSFIQRQHPHRSAKTAPARSVTLEPHYTLNFRFAVTGNELTTFLLNTPNTLAIPRPNSNEAPSPEYLLENLLSQNSFVVHGSCVGSDVQSPGELTLNFGSRARAGATYSIFERGANREYAYRGSVDGSSGYDLGVILTNYFKARTYAFRAERFTPGTSPLNGSGVLDPTAANLPDVLATLMTHNPARFKRYNELIARIFPHIRGVTAPITRQTAEIRLWLEDPETERDDLAVPLSESGTGVAQVLAMLAVLVTSDDPRVLIIDEPNAFLHPAALHRLIAIFREHQQHQYIVSTNTPDLVACAGSAAVVLLSREGAETVVRAIDPADAQDARDILAEVGARLSDVFAAERVLWVEGATEEKVIRAIAEHYFSSALVGTSILGVLHTGDFDGDDASTVLRIYKKLSSSSALLPTAVGFIFDRELRPERDREDLIRMGKGTVAFLRRRTLENYLLNPKAIAHVLESLGHTVDVARVEKSIAKHTNSRMPKGWADTTADLDAPRLLGDVFWELTNNAVEFNKISHSVALAEWVLQNAPDELNDIVTLLRRFLMPTPYA